MRRIISAVPNVVVYVAAAGAIYYFLIYETDEDKAVRLKRDALARQQGGYRQL